MNVLNNDRISEVFHGHLQGDLTTSLAQERIAWICSQVGPGRVLDLGCSQGITSILLARQGLPVCSADVEHPAVRYAANDLEKETEEVRRRVHLMMADGAGLPFGGGIFDTVVFGEVLEHLDEPFSVLREIRRVLKAGGRLVLTTPFGYLPHEDHKRTYYLHSLLRTTERFFTVTHLDIQGNHYIRYVGSRAGVEGEGPPGLAALEPFMVLLEQKLLTKEERYVEDLNELRDRWNAANRKYREATAMVATYKERIQRLSEQSDEPIPEETPVERVLRRDLEAALKEVSTVKAEVARRVEDLKHQRNLLEEMRQGQEETQRERLQVRQQLLETTAELAQERANSKELLEDMASLRERKRKVEADRRRLRESNQELVEVRDRLRQDLWASNEDKIALRERYANAVRSFQSQKKRNEQLDSDVRALRYQVRVVENSRAWKLVRLYWRFRQELLAGNGQQRRKFLSDVWQILRRRLGKPRREVRFEERLVAFLNRVRTHRSSSVVFMFSGTTYIQEHRGNRPIRLSRVLLSRKVPVLFSYWRWRASEPMPQDSDSLLFQSPIDLTLQHMERIAGHDFGTKKKIFVITFPHVSCVRYINIFRAQGWVTLYDIRDDWEEFHKVGAARWYNNNYERYIANNADVLTAVSRPLKTKIEGYLESGEVHLSPNALDTRYPTGRQVKVRPVEGPPVIGYVGHLTASWFDWDALVKTARQRTDWTLEIIGHSMPQDLELPPNLRYLGPMDYREILARTRTWRAAVIPFKICALSDGVDPIKVYEYLAMGLPVVSFRMPQIHEYPYVYIAHNQEEFVERLEEALRVEMDPARIRDFLAVNRWQDRVDQLLQWQKVTRETGDFRDLAEPADIAAEGGE